MNIKYQQPKNLGTKRKFQDTLYEGGGNSEADTKKWKSFRDKAKQIGIAWSSLFTGAPQGGKTTFCAERVLELEKFVFKRLGGDNCQLIIVCKCFETQLALYGAFKDVPGLKVFTELTKETINEIYSLRKAYNFKKPTVIILDDMSVGKASGNSLQGDFISAISQAAESKNTFFFASIHDTKQVPPHCRSSIKYIAMFSVANNTEIKNLSEWVSYEHTKEDIEKLLRTIWSKDARYKILRPCCIWTNYTKGDPVLEPYYTNAVLRKFPTGKYIMIDDITMSFIKYEQISLRGE